MPEALIREFWRRMNTNDFAAASLLLCEDYSLHYPQSGERFRGRAAFVAINRDYPAHGPWRFTLLRLVAQAEQVVSEVTVTDGVLRATALTFSQVREGRIASEVQYWPDPFGAPAWRRLWLEPPDA